MSFKVNVIANYASQIYVALIGIFMIPLCVRYMGAEAYGLVGFFAMIQAWFQLLDIGLTPTITRETARFCGGGIDATSLRRLARLLETIFVVVACLGGLLMWLGSDLIASKWLNAQNLDFIQVKHSISLMGAIVAFRWMCGLYRGLVAGMERLVWLSGFNILFATARFVLVMPWFWWVGARPVDYFIYQLGVAIAEILAIGFFAYRSLPPAQIGSFREWDFAPLKASLKFSLGVAFTGAIWVLVTQTDKLVLSRLLPLKIYGYFTLAVLAAGAVNLLGGPISAALLPRLTRLNAEGKEDDFIGLYRLATQVVAVFVIPASVVIARFAYPLLLAWTKDPEIAQSASPILALYVLGNAVLALGAFPYYLQYAKGDLKLHIVGNGIYLLLLLPALIGLTYYFGAIGAGWAWLGSNMLFFLFWLPLVHGRFMKGLHRSWLLEDIGPTALIASLGVFLTALWPVSGMARFTTIWVSGLIGILLVSICVLVSGALRCHVFKFFGFGYRRVAYKFIARN